jgi:hypothetical protein
MEKVESHLNSNPAPKRNSPTPTGLRSSQHDRTVFAIGTAAFGVGVGGLMILTRNLESKLAVVAVNLSFFALIVGSRQLVNRVTRTTPRHANRLSSLGWIGSMLVALTVALPALNWREQTKHSPFALQLAAAAVVALPCWLAAVAIHRGHS